MPHASPHHRTMQDVFGYYNFIDKDPVIDVLRAMVELEAKVRGVSIWRQMQDTANGAGMHVTTLQYWFFGAGRTPRFAYVQRVANALGYEFSEQPLRRKRGRPH